MDILISLIIPVYNVEKYIRRCLDSVFNQSVKINFEVIVINDGTPDDSMEIVSEYVAINPNLRIINQENKGLSAARNSGLRAAQGKYIWFVDSDDWISVDAFEKLNSYLTTSIPVIATNLMYSYDDLSKNFLERIIDKDSFVTSRFYFNNFSIGAVQRYIIEKDFLQKIVLSFTEGIYHEDAEFGAILVYKSKDIFVLKDSIYYYYQRETGSIMSDWKIKNTLDYLTVYSRLTVFMNNSVIGHDKDFFSWYLFRLLSFAFPKRHLMVKKDLREVFKRNCTQLRLKAISIIKYNLSSLKRFVLILIFIISPLLFINLQSFYNKKN